MMNRDKKSYISLGAYVLGAAIIFVLGALFFLITQMRDGNEVAYLDEKNLVEEFYITLLNYKNDHGVWPQAVDQMDLGNPKIIQMLQSSKLLCWVDDNVVGDKKKGLVVILLNPKGDDVEISRDSSGFQHGHGMQSKYLGRGWRKIE